jgi:hypothetical protein
MIHLIWIVPLVFSAGLALGCLLSANRLSRCRDAHIGTRCALTIAEAQVERLRALLRKHGVRMPKSRRSGSWSYVR